MEKILFALGNREIEKELHDRLKGDFKIAGAVLRKGQIIQAIHEIKPDILILRENIDGNENIRDILMKIRMDYPYVRVIFLAGHRQVGDMLLSLMVTYGIYDILCGGSVNIGDIVGLVYSKNDYKDVHHLQPNVIFDDSNTPHFSMPEVVNIERKNIVVKPSAQSEEVTSKMRKEIEEELMVKMKTKLREEFNTDYQILLQKGQMKEREIKKKLENEYKEKIIKKQEEIRVQAENELSSRVNEEVNRAKLKMQEKLKERESLLRSQMESKIKDVLRQNAELKNKYEAEEYEMSIRKRLEEELRCQLEKEKEEAEKIRVEEFELSKQKELSRIKSQLLQKIEEDGKKALFKKEQELTAQIENRKNEELKREVERLERKKKEEIEQEKVELEKIKREEIDSIKADLESKKMKELKLYEHKIREKQDGIKAKLVKEMEEKAASEIEKVKSDMLGKLKSREAKLRGEMEEKIKDVLRQNAELKNKYEAEEYEMSIRKKLEEELREKLQKEKVQAEKERAKKEKEKEEELERNKTALINKLKNESKKELSVKIKELETKNAKVLESQIKELEVQKEREIDEFKKSLESKVSDKVEKLEMERQEELRRLEVKRREDLKRLEAQKEREKEEELKRLEAQKEMERQEEVRRLEARRVEEMRRLEMEKEEEMRRLEMEKEEEMRRVKAQKERERQEELRRLEARRVEEIKELESRMVKEKEEFIKSESQFTMKNNQKIVSFIGGKNGVGTTTVAINVAAGLASQGKRVLYIELNAQTPSIGYWYRLDTETGGLEDALTAVQNGRYGNIEANVIKSSKLKKGEYGRLYKNFPNTLDFLLFSQQETLVKKDRIEFERGELKELYFYLMQHAGYEYIILDLRIDESDEWAIGSMLFSTKVYSIVTQDVSSLAYINYRLDRLERINIPVKRKNSYIINRLDEKSCKLKQREIKSWLDGSSVYTCPDLLGEVMNSIYDGEPLILNTRSKEFKKSINNIVEDIIKKNKK